MAEKECPLARIAVIIAYFNYRNSEQYSSKIKTLEGFMGSALCHKENCELWDIGNDMCSISNRLLT